MTSPLPWDAAAIKQLASQLTTLRPAYAAIIDFYAAVFALQVQSAEDISPAAIRLDPEVTRMKSDQGFAVIEPASFTVDTPVAEHLLIRICEIAAGSGEKLGAAGEALLGAMDEGVALDGLFNDVLDDQGRINDLARTMDVPPEMVSLLLYLAIKPSLEAGARQLSSHLPEAPQPNRGSCPICSSPPIIGELDSEGRHALHCGLCWHRWPVKRMLCPFCSQAEGASVEYLYSDDEPEYRVNLCGGCRCYLKVVDTRKMTRRFYPPLEQVASLHLDMLAVEKGYVHALGTDAPLG
jgi:FdhE protein